MPALATQLREVEYTPLVSVTAFVERSAMAHEVNGVGVLIPAVEKRKCLGILFSSSAFPGRVTNEGKHASFTLLMGGSADRGWVNADDETIKVAVQQELSELLGLRGEPLETIIHRWPRAIPQYSIALPKLWQLARESWCASKGRILFGNYTGQVTMRGMIESASTLPGATRRLNSISVSFPSPLYPNCAIIGPTGSS
jgi:oxygen-dependent protoporphyrinogen oxidase